MWYTVGVLALLLFLFVLVLIFMFVFAFLLSRTTTGVQLTVRHHECKHVSEMCTVCGMRARHGRQTLMRR